MSQPGSKMMTVQELHIKKCCLHLWESAISLHKKLVISSSNVHSLNLLESHGAYVERKSIFEHYVERDPDVEGIEQVSLLEFATHWDWRGRNLHKHTRKSPFAVGMWPLYTPDLHAPDLYEKYCYARLILHHPFRKVEDVLEGWGSFTDAYTLECKDLEHVHDDLLPIITHQPEDPNSDSESVHVNNDDDGPMRFQWMQEVARGPNSTTAVSTADNLGCRDMDLHYDWHGNSPRSTQIIQDAAHWLAACVKESPNDDIQLLPPALYASLKGPQRIVFLQVMAYFKKLAQNPNLKTPTLHVNVDGTAGTGKTYLIWAITHALHQHFSYIIGPNHDPVVCLAPTGVAAFGIRGWTLNYGLTIPVKDGWSGFEPLDPNALKHIQT
ncbi:hypothetical protein EV368DRAFT_89179 [Lentinula lateritia]|nr:hypothetical protein EV368DRAFT_89179 [Lentinula lateritia]